MNKCIILRLLQKLFFQSLALTLHVKTYFAKTNFNILGHRSKKFQRLSTFPLFILLSLLFVLLGFRWPVEGLVEQYETLDLQFLPDAELFLRDPEPVFTVSNSIPLPRGSIEIFDYQRGFWGAQFSQSPRVHRLFDREGRAQISHHTILPHRGDRTRPRLLDLRFETLNSSQSLVTWRNNVVPRDQGFLRLIITDNSVNDLGTGIEVLTLSQGGQQVFTLFPGIIEELNGILTRKIEPRIEYRFQEIRFSSVPAIEILVPIGFSQMRNLLSVQVIDFEGNLNSLQFVVIYQESPQ